MSIFRDVAIVLAAGVAAGLLFWRIRQPLILGYVLAGLLLSPLTPGPRIHDVHTFQVMAEVGVVLLMFSVGTEFSVPELLRVKWVALVGGPIGVLLSIGLGAGAGLLIGWPLIQGIAVGCIVAVASTMVLVRLLVDRGELTSEAGRLMVSITLVEDLAVVILTIILSGLGNTSGLNRAEIFRQTGMAILLLVPIVFVAWKVMPRLLAQVKATGNEELSALVVLGICLAAAATTEALGLSLALGAFVGGLLLGSCRDAHELAAKILPMRDVFVALFFISVGMIIDPRSLFSDWQALVVMAGLIVAGKFFIWFTVVRLFGYPAQTAFRVGTGLTQIGELSFILASVSLRGGLISESVYNAALAASLLSILANAALFRLLGTAHDRVPQSAAIADAAAVV
ncbi:MAG TPA: cation:proton antiporter [Bryobacteraceae bacterium]|jgi:CPA2 family monovalent cation:H+ antiporter-2